MIHPTWFSLEKNSRVSNLTLAALLLSRRSECRPTSEKNKSKILGKNTHTAPRTNMEPSWNLEIDGFGFVFFLFVEKRWFFTGWTIIWDAFITIWNTTIHLGEYFLVHFFQASNFPTNLSISNDVIWFWEWISLAKGGLGHPRQQKKQTNS